MDRAGQVASGMNLTALKEPRGFIKCLEWILAIFAFATTTSFSSVSRFSVACPEAEKLSVKEIYFQYPFRLYETKFSIPFCNATKTDEVGPYGNFASAAEFYVFVGVMAFLYSMASLAVYIFFDEKYRKFENIPIADFITTGVLSVFFLISTSAWAQNVTHLKWYTNPEELFIKKIPECMAGSSSGVKCKVLTYGNFAGVNVSLIFGFLNCALWAANLWFLFKETKWFKHGAEYQEPVGGPSASSWSTEEGSFKNDGNR